LRPTTARSPAKRLRQRAAERGLHPEGGEEGARDARHRHPQRLAGPGEAHARVAGEPGIVGEAREGAAGTGGGAREVVEVLRREGGHDPSFAVSVADPDQPLRGAEGERPQQHGEYGAEDHGIGAQADGEGEQRRGDVTLAAAEGAQRLEDIGGHRGLLIGWSL
jgi:hypothetical protein